MPVLSTLAEVVDVVLQRVEAQAGEQPPTRLLVSVSGVPGSGKTTLAARIADAVGERLGTPGAAVAVPMDGYHLSRAQLAAMDNPEEAVRRRGAHWTFDPAALATALEMARRGGEPACFPGFDHSEGDPCAGQHGVSAGCRVVVMEGNYLCYRGLDVWRRVADAFDVALYLDCEPRVATERLVRRHVAAWGVSEEVARERAAGSDYVNSLLIRTCKESAQFKVGQVPLGVSSTV